MSKDGQGRVDREGILRYAHSKDASLESLRGPEAAQLTQM